MMLLSSIIGRPHQKQTPTIPVVIGTQRRAPPLRLDTPLLVAYGASSMAALGVSAGSQSDLPEVLPCRLAASRVEDSEVPPCRLAELQRGGRKRHAGEI
jgi:hypothetical protein